MEQNLEQPHAGKHVDSITTYGVLATAWRPTAPTTRGYPPGPISFKSLCSYFEYTTGETFISVTQEQFNQLSLSEPALVRPGGYHAVKPFAGEVGSIGRFRIFIAVDWEAEHARKPKTVYSVLATAWGPTMTFSTVAGREAKAKAEAVDCAVSKTPETDAYLAANQPTCLTRGELPFAHHNVVTAFIDMLANRCRRFEALAHEHGKEAKRLSDILFKSGICEIAAHNPGVMEFVKHWEDRALKAEDRCARLQEQLDGANQLHLGAVRELHRSFEREEKLAKTLRDREARSNPHGASRNPALQQSWNYLRDCISKLEQRLLDRPVRASDKVRHPDGRVVTQVDWGMVQQSWERDSNCAAERFIIIRDLEKRVDSEATERIKQERRADSWVKAARDLAEKLGLLPRMGGDKDNNAWNDWALIERFALNYQWMRSHGPWDKEVAGVNGRGKFYHAMFWALDEAVEAERKKEPAK